MKKLIKLLTMLYTLVFLSVITLAVTGASHDEEYYRLKYRGILDDLKNRDTQVWNSFTDADISNTLSENGWFLEPLNRKLVEYSGFQFSITDTVRYANTWAYDWGVRMEETCKQGLIRDMYPTFPTNEQFKKCAVTPDQWRSAYAANAEAIRASFDVPPPVFKSYSDWPPRFVRKQEYNGGVEE